MAETAAPKDPVLDIRVRWRAGQVLLGFAGVMALVAFSRPLAAWSPAWLKAFGALALGLGVSAAALLASLRGHKQPETIALHAFLVLSVDALGQLMGAHGFPVWPLMALLVASPPGGGRGPPPPPPGRPPPRPPPPPLFFFFPL